MIKALKLALEALENGDVPTPENAGKNLDAIAAIKEALAKEKTLQALHSENERLGLYKDAYAQPKPQIKTTDPFESSRVGDYNQGWNDCLFASGIVKQPEQEPVAWEQFHGHMAGPFYQAPLQEQRSCDKRTEQEPVCPECKAEVLYECVACSRNNYPPQRTWVGLEGEEIRNLWEEVTKPDRSTMTLVTSFARAIEAKLKERNT